LIDIAFEIIIADDIISSMGLKEAFEREKFVITTELCPPKGVDVEKILGRASMLKGLVDAINVTDNHRAKMNLSSLAFSCLLLKEGHDPIFQMTCRDRNSLALQSDILGAYTMGIRNILALTGDQPPDTNKVKPVFEIDSVGLIRLINKLQKGEDFYGDKLSGKPRFLVGGAINPSVKDLKVEAKRLIRKIDTGIDFVQSQIIFETSKVKELLKLTKRKGFKFIASILPLKSHKTAVFIREKVHGVHLPDVILKRMEEASDQAEEGENIAIELIQELEAVCDGVHLITMNNIEVIPRIVSKLSSGGFSA
jgi:5,10-methylenetetrahydrofolate reductase